MHVEAQPTRVTFCLLNYKKMPVFGTVNNIPYNNIVLPVLSAARVSVIFLVSIGIKKNVRDDK